MSCFDRLAEGSDCHDAKAVTNSLQLWVKDAGDPQCLRAFNRMVEDVEPELNEEGYHFDWKLAHSLASGEYDTVVILRDD